MVDRFLYALFWFGKRHPESFHVVETIRGATKPYFSKSAKRFINGGRSGNPRNIPGTRYWVSTDCSTKRKVQIIDRVMKTLGYAKNDIARVTAKLVPEGNARGVQLEMSGLDREELPDQI